VGEPNGHDYLAASADDPFSAEQAQLEAARRLGEPLEVPPGFGS
jgi:hypothetical protein